MNDHSDPAQLSDVLWTDAEIRSIQVDYNALTIRIRETTGRDRTIKCDGHIGYRLVGFWDEVVVERASLTTGGPFLDECLQSLRRRFGSTPPMTGDPARNTRSWQLLSVQLADGAHLEVAAAAFTTEQQLLACRNDHMEFR